MAGFVERRGRNQWKARIRMPGGREVSKTWTRKVDAEAWLDEQRVAMRAGTWVDPRRSRTRFGPWATEWLAGQVHFRDNTAATQQNRFAVHILPTFGERPFDSITTASVRAWVKELTAKGLAPRTVHGVYGLFAQLMGAAVEDLMIARSPCRKVPLPEIIEDITIPMLSQLELVESRLPARYRRMVSTAAGSGVRQGEGFGLTLDRVDWAGRALVIDRQWQNGAHAPVKRKRSNRVIPVGRHTLRQLADQVDEFPPAERCPCGCGSKGLLFLSTAGSPLARPTFTDGWERATRVRDPDRVGAAHPLEAYGERDPALLPYFTFHDARHFYASLLIRKGLSVVAVAARMGQREEETLRTYAHLWPDDDDRTRDAVDSVLLVDDEDVEDGAGDDDSDTAAA